MARLMVVVWAVVATTEIGRKGRVGGVLTQ